jgi:phosphoribosylanthranilate isomerase
MDPSLLRKFRGDRINKVGVFVNESPDQVKRAIEDCGLYLVQLHGDETPKYCEKMADFIGVIKAFRIQPGDDILWKIKDYQDIVDFFLFDTAGAGYGGTGKKFDWSALQDLNIGKPFFLSGGIGPTDAPSVIDFSRQKASKDLFALDLNSKFETAPGIKNMDTLVPFLHQLLPQP